MSSRDRWGGGDGVWIKSSRRRACATAGDRKSVEVVVFGHRSLVTPVVQQFRLNHLEEADSYVINIHHGLYMPSPRKS